MAIVNGFAGVREDHGGELRFSPRLPSTWTRLQFRLIVRGRFLEVDMTHDATTYRLLEGDGLRVVSDGEAHLLRQGAAATVAHPTAAQDADLVDAVPGSPG